MCVYVYVPNGQILIDYLLEEVFLYGLGNAKILTDLRIVNLSDHPINQFTILTSRSYFKRIRLGENNRPKVTYGGFWDATNEIISQDLRKNLFYKSCGNEIEYDPKSEKLRMKLFNSVEPAKRIIKEGKIVIGELKPRVFEDPFMNIILDALEYSVFEYVLPSEGLESGDSLFLRLGSNPKNPFVQGPQKKLYWAKRFLYWFIFDTLSLNYSFIGPYDVRKEFSSDLTHYLGSTENANLIRATKDLEERLLKEYERPETNSIYTKMLFHIAPQTLRLTHSFFMHGDVIPIGRLPRYYAATPFPSNWLTDVVNVTKSWKNRVYIWLVNLYNEKIELGKEDELGKYVPKTCPDLKRQKPENHCYFQINVTASLRNMLLRGLIFISVITIVITYICRSLAPRIITSGQLAFSFLDRVYRGSFVGVLLGTATVIAIGLGIYRVYRWWRMR